MNEGREEERSIQVRRRFHEEEGGRNEVDSEATERRISLT